MLKELIFSFMAQHAPMGGSWHSVEPMPECGDDPFEAHCEIGPVCEEPTMLCRAPRWSYTHDSWVRSETAETARVRYDLASQTLNEMASFVLCLDEDGEKRKDCKKIQRRCLYPYNKRNN